MEFTAELVLSSIEHLNDDARASQYLTAWAQSEHPEVQIIELLSQDLSESAQFVCLTLLESVIPNRYHLMTQESRRMIASLLRGELESLCSVPVFEKVVVCYCRVALFELPEMPDFDSLVLSSGTSDSKLISVSLHVLAVFLSELERSRHLSPPRVALLRSHIWDWEGYLVELVSWSFEHDVQVKYGMQILSFLFSVVSNEKCAALIDFARKICYHYVKQENLVEACASCLLKVLQRWSPGSVFQYQLLYLISLAGRRSIGADGRPLMQDASVCNLLLVCCSRSVIQVCGVLNGSPLYSAGRQTAEEMGVTPEELKTAVLNVIGASLSLRDPLMLQGAEYEEMWCVILEEMVREQTRPEQERSVSKVIMPVWNDVLQNIFETLPDLVDDCGKPDEAAIHRWSLIAKVDVRRMLAFLSQQSPSNALCYGLANLSELAQTTQMFNWMEVSILVKSIFEQAREATDVNTLTATLYALSSVHIPDLFDTYFHFCMKCMIDVPNDSVAHAAIESLLSSSHVYSAMMVRDEYLPILCEQGENYLGRLSPNNRVDVFKFIVGILVRITDTDKKLSHLALLMDPVKNSLSNAEALSVDDVISVLDIIIESVGIMGADCGPIEEMKPAVVGLASKIIPNNDNVSLVCSCLRALSSLVVNSNPLDLDLFNTAASFMSARTQPVEYFLDFFSLCSPVSNVLDRMFDMVVDQFVMPVLPDDDFLRHILYLLQKFPNSLMCPWFMDVCIRGIKSLSYSDNVCAVNCITSLWTPENASVWTPTMQPLLFAVFEAILDLMHNNSIVLYARLLSNIFMKAADLGHLETIVIPATNEALASLLPDANPEYISEFTTHLARASSQSSSLRHVQSFCAFKEALMNFMILLRKMSPCDSHFFSDSSHRRSFSEILSGIIGSTYDLDLLKIPGPN